MQAVSARAWRAFRWHAAADRSSDGGIATDSRHCPHIQDVPDLRASAPDTTAAAQFFHYHGPARPGRRSACDGRPGEELEFRVARLAGDKPSARPRGRTGRPSGPGRFTQEGRRGDSECSSARVFSPCNSDSDWGRFVCQKGRTCQPSQPAPGIRYPTFVKWAFLADAVVILHAAYVGFVVLGFAAIFVGVARGWNWVRSFGFRLAHLSAIALACVESILGSAWPLTTVENGLRGRAGQARYPGNFVGYWAHRLIFYDAPPWRSRRSISP